VSTPSVSASPLAGLRVIDITTVMLGPYATQILGDYGADVVKVESPNGDSTRSTGPATEAGMAAAFIGANRSKRSIVLDLKHPAGRDALLALADHADVVVCSVRPQKMRALGLGQEVLRARNPRLIVVGIHGFAEAGPYAGRPAYDDIIQGLCGLASLGELQGQEPAYVPTVMADKTCALFAVQAVLLALAARSTGGQGSYVEVPMLECMVNFTLVEHAYGALFRPPLSEPGYLRLLTPWRRPYRTRDGYICVVPYSTAHWQRFFEAAGEAQLMLDARFLTLSERTRHIDALYRELARCLAGDTTAHWLETCERLDIPAAPMRRLAELEGDPHLAATGFFLETDDPDLGRFVLPRPPLIFDGMPAAPGLPPRLGQHTVDVLRECGLSPESIARMLEEGAAVQHPEGKTA
jgi:hypothetical protein